MKLIMVSINEIANNIYFENETNIENKKKFRNLSDRGKDLAKKIALDERLSDVERIYADEASYTIDAASYLAKTIDMEVVVNTRLHDLKVGDLKNKSIKMLSYFQEHDFNFKLNMGESINECGKRIQGFIHKLIDDGYEKVIMYLPKRCMLSYLINYVDTDFNLDDRLILTYEDEVILGLEDEEVNIVGIDYSGKNIKIENIKVD